MSERTTIGGVTYESVGSSSSNLLLKCNGTARIQWGSKLIDLVKNGKIAAGDSSSNVSVVTSEADIKTNGIYVLNTEETLQLWVYKDGEKYNLTGTNLYISASNKQDFTAEQRGRALENIGMYYNTLEDVKKSEVKNGLVYVLENSTLYTIKEGIINEFEAKLKTVSVEKEEETGEVINSSIRIAFSIIDDEYLVLENRRITANYDVHVKETAQLGSEGADEMHGYRMYINGDTSILEVDEIKVRHGLPIEDDNHKVTYTELQTLVESSELEPHEWYILTDYLNPWKFGKPVDTFRPLLLRALTTNTFYPTGFLLDDQSITIQYDINYQETVMQYPDNADPVEVTTRGKITWMKDAYNNEANFDFLDYVSSDGSHLTTLHKYNDSSNFLSIFPKGSYNNKITAYDLAYTVIKEGSGQNSDTITTVIDFQFDDSEDALMNMHDNVIECRGLILKPDCSNFYGNILNQVCKLEISADFINNTFGTCYYKPNWEEIESFYDITDYVLIYPVEFTKPMINVKVDAWVDNFIDGDMYNVSIKKLSRTISYAPWRDSSFGDVKHLLPGHSAITNCKFKNITNCIFLESYIQNVICDIDIKCSDDDENIEGYTLEPIGSISLYNTPEKKELYERNGVYYVTEIHDNYFHRGMIMMHSGTVPIPYGWGICNGNTYEFNGVSVQTPDLRNRFIKAVESSEQITSWDNPDLNADKELVLTKAHLPEHNHPHQEHTHTITGTSINIDQSGDLSLSFDQTINTSDVTSTTASAVTSVTSEGITTESGNFVNSVSGSSQENSISKTITGGNHTHTATITEGTISSNTSEETTQTWENKAIKIEPDYYSLIFIMKL